MIDWAVQVIKAETTRDAYFFDLLQKNPTALSQAQPISQTQ